MARPKKKPADIRGNRVNLKFNDSDFEAIKRVQEQRHFSYPADAVHWMAKQYIQLEEFSSDIWINRVDCERIRFASKRAGLRPEQTDSMILSLLSPFRVSDEHIVREMEESQ